MIDNESLKLTLSLIKPYNENGFVFSSKLIYLPYKIDFVRNTSNEKIPSIDKFLKIIYNKYLDIVTITNRLAWQKDLWMTQNLSTGEWMYFAKLDVEFFFIKIRSIFDYVKSVLLRVSDETKIPCEKRKTFNKLRNWLTDSEKGKDNAKKWDQELADLILSIDWFEVMKDIRDSFIHEGGYTIVYPEKERILFQVYKRNENQISIPEIMFNDKVVDFEKFAGLHFGYLTKFLENFAEIVEKRLPQKVRDTKAEVSAMYRKKPVIIEWIEELV